MASEPRTVRELNFAVEGRLGLLTKMVFVLAALLVSIAGGVALVYQQLGGVAVNVATTTERVTGLGERVARIEKQLENIAAGQAQQMSSLGRIEARLPNQPRPDSSDIVALTPAEAEFVRSALKAIPVPMRMLGKFKLGDNLAEGTLVPVPEQVSEKLPKLKGAKFAFDQDGSIAITAGINNRIIGIVPPG